MCWAPAIFGMLEDKATFTEKSTLCPCGYLGYLVRGDAFAATAVFEPDPAKWPLDAFEAAGGDSSNIYVWYEWKYVTLGPERKPHRVRMKVGDIGQILVKAPQIETER